MLEMNDRERGIANRGINRSSTQKKVKSRTVVSETNRLVAFINVVGHASPRWRSTSSPEKADKKNAALAARRADAVAKQTKMHLTELLPNKDLAFDVNMSVDEQVDVGPDLIVGSESRGSRQTLIEAGARGRTANDQSMRRVDVEVQLRHSTDTDVEDEVEGYQRVSGNSRNWSIQLVGEVGLSVGAKAGIGLISLRNKKMKRTAEYFTEAGGADVGVGLSIAKSSWSPTSFTTPAPMSFSDFSGARFVFEAKSISVGIGYEWSKFSFVSFMDSNKKVPKPIRTSAGTAGGLSVTQHRVVMGTM